MNNLDEEKLRDRLAEEWSYAWGEGRFQSDDDDIVIDTKKVADFFIDKIGKDYQAGITAEKKRITDLLQRHCLDYCEKQNGRSDCKNCGLSIDIIE
jgi:hypothetical protein